MAFLFSRLLTLAPFLLLEVLGAKVNLDDYPDVVDMSHRLKENETLYFSGYPMGYEAENVFSSNDILKHGLWVEANKFEMVIHVGTHMDAPCHICKTCWRMHEIPFEKLRGPAAVFNIKAQCDENPDYEMTLADIEKWEEENGRIPDGALVMVATGGQSRWPNWEKYFGAEYLNHTLQMPGVSVDAIKFLVDEREINGVGADWGVVDSGPSLNTEDIDYYGHAHRKLLGNNKLIIEYVKNIELLPPTGYTIYLNPLKLHDTCGAPARVLAVKNPPSQASAMGKPRLELILALMVLIGCFF